MIKDKMLKGASPLMLHLAASLLGQKIKNVCKFLAPRV